MLIPGTEIGDLVVETALCSDAISVVYRVRQEDTGRSYALKVFSRSAEGFGSQLVDQARTLAHPGIVPVRQILQVGGRPGLLQELVEGPTLNRWIAETRPGLDEALEVFREILAAVSHAHRVGVYHWDLHPGNVLMYWSHGAWRPRISAFGVARLVAEDGADRGAGPSLGTPGYLSPEQYVGAEELDERADIFSLGTLLYELVTCVPAFPQPARCDRRAATMAERYTAPEHLVPGLPEEISRAIVGCLKKAPPARWVSCAGIASALPRAPRPAPISDQPTELYLPQEADARLGSQVPQVFDAFVGRESELSCLGEWSESQDRVLTIKGAGGMGKTRLALRFAETNQWRYPGGAWFIDLTCSRDQSTMLRTVAQVIGVPLEPRGGIFQLGRALHSMGRALLVLDNLEQISAVATGVVREWLESSEDLCILQTSRRALEIPGARTLELGPLAGDGSTVHPGTVLFEARARSLQPSLDLDANEQAAVGRIVDSLSGIPLAVELVAAQSVEAMPTEILASLQGAGLKRDGVMETCLDWSWSRLSPAEQLVLSQVSIFESGFTVEAAEAVVQIPAEMDATPVFDLLQRLVRHSFLLLEGAAGPGIPGRLQVIDLLRAYGLQFLRDRSSVQARHAEYFAHFGSLDFQAEVCAHGAAGRYNALLLEIDNLASATAVALDAGRDDVATDLLSAGDLLADRGFRWLGWREMVADVYSRTPSDAPHRCALARMLGWEMNRAGDWSRAVDLFSEALGVAERTDQPAQALLNRVGLACALRMGGERVRAYASVSPVPAAAQGLELWWIEVRALMALSGLIPGDSEMQKGILHLKKAIDIASTHGDIRGEIAASVNLATVLANKGQQDQADSCMEAILPKVPRLGPSRLEAEVMSIAGIRTLRRGEVDLAVERLRRAARLILGLGEQRKKTLVRVRLMRALAAQGSTREVEELREKVFTDGSLESLDASTRYDVWVNLAHVALTLGDSKALTGAMKQVEAILAGHPSAHVMLLYGGDLQMLREAVAQGSASGPASP